MLRGCFVVALVILVVLLAAAGVAAYQLDKRYGLWQASPVSHETLSRESTRLRASVRPEALGSFLLSALPPDTELPGWVPFSMNDALPRILPHEIALLGNADYRNSMYQLTFFVNERRGGPLIAQLVNQSDLFTQLQEVRWDPEGVRFRERGVITAEGSLPLPEDIEDRLLAHWTHAAPAAPMHIEGGRVLELALDNRNGDALALWAALALASGQNFTLILEDPVSQAILEILPQIYTLRLSADLLNEDTLKLLLRIEADPSTGPNLQFMLGAFVIPTFQQTLRDDFGMTLKGDAVWRGSEGALVGDFTLTGFRKPFLDALRGTAAAPPSTPEQPAS